MRKITIQNGTDGKFVYVEQGCAGMWRADFGGLQPRFIATDNTLFCREHTIDSVVDAVAAEHFPRHKVVRVDEGWFCIMFEVPDMTPEKFAANYFLALLKGEIECTGN